MINVNGRYTDAKVFTDKPEQKALDQVKEMCDQPFMAGSQVRIMPDYHAGKGCVIGTTMTIKDKVVPNLVGVDVGCGVLTVELGDKEIDFQLLDDVIREYVPSGTGLHSYEKSREAFINGAMFDKRNFKAGHVLDNMKSGVSMGTLGGGNHFTEVSKGEDGTHYLTVHTGSRYVGAKIASYYQKEAIAQMGKQDIGNMIQELKDQGRHQEIQSAIQKFKSENPTIPKELAYCEGQLLKDYLHDMELAQQFAKHNRSWIADTIIEKANLKQVDFFDTVHNYIDTFNMILRKGAVAAYENQRLIIPINMRDGSIIAIGKGNSDWNYSAPHGAGRVLSRTQARKNLSVEDYQATMKDVWTTSANEETLDEAPMAYKPMEDILNQIGETVDVLEVIKPVYNFKAS